MSTAKKLNLFAGLVGLFITAPIWYYLMYQMLDRVNASELMWFLYWIYMPTAIVLGIVGRVAAASADD